MNILLLVILYSLIPSKYTAFSSNLLLFHKMLISFCFYVFLWISFYFGYYHPFFSYLQILFNSFLSLKVSVWQRCSCCNKYNFFHDKYLQEPTFQKNIAIMINKKAGNFPSSCLLLDHSSLFSASSCLLIDNIFCCNRSYTTINSAIPFSEVGTRK